MIRRRSMLLFVLVLFVMTLLLCVALVRIELSGSERCVCHRRGYGIVHLIDRRRDTVIVGKRTQTATS